MDRADVAPNPQWWP